MKKITIHIILLAIMSVFVFADSVRNPFFLDDRGLIEENKYIRQLNPGVFFTSAYWKDYRTFKTPVVIPLKPLSPVRILSFAVDYKLWKLNPAGYHLTNLLLHIFNVILVYMLCLLIFKNNMAAMFSGLLFATHPMHAESILWIKNRIDLITLIFYLSALILFIKALGGKILGKSSSLRIAVVSIVCFAFALLSKEMAITLPAILALYVFCFIPRENWKKGLMMTTPFWLICIPYLYIEFVVLKAGKVMFFTGGEIGVYSNILVVFKTIAYYLKLLLFPFTLCIERPLEISRTIFEPAVLVSLAAMVLCLGIAFVLFKRNREYSFFWLWVFIAILPIANIFFLSTRPIAEQRLYIPSVGFCVLLGVILARNAMASNGWKRTFSYAIFIGILSFYSLSTVNRNFDWRDPVLMWKKAAKMYPSSFRAHFNLGNAYDSGEMLSGALQEYERAAGLSPNHPFLFNSLGVVYQRMGNVEESVKAFKKAIDLYPGFDNAHANLGWSYFFQGKHGQAVQELEKAVRINPDYAMAHYSLGDVYRKMGDYEKAVKEYQCALEISPFLADFRQSLAGVLEKTGDYDAAMDQYRKILTGKPLSVEARNDLAVAYAQKGMYKEAEKEFEKVFSIDPSNAVVRKNYWEMKKLMRDLGEGKRPQDIRVDATQQGEAAEYN